MIDGMEVDGVLEDWYVSFTSGGFILYGDIYGDAKGRFYDGQFIHTSSVRSCSHVELKEGMIVTTRNSVYKLGKER